jgi:hypothetical protein
MVVPVQPAVAAVSVFAPLSSSTVAGFQLTIDRTLDYENYDGWRGPGQAGRRDGGVAGEMDWLGNARTMDGDQDLEVAAEETFFDLIDSELAEDDVP